MARAREWSLRCFLEHQRHDHACWATLTYSDANLPPTLCVPHLQRFNRNLRKHLRFRFFASGEYGDTTYRPHYHIILFGVPETAAELIQSSWKHGYARVDPLTPAAISYVAGYCSKKLSHKADREERINYETGEVYTFQPPFTLMSRRPGIAGDDREYAASWRSHAVLGGQIVPVPRFLHEAWKARASPEALEQLQKEKDLRAIELNRDISLDRTMKDRNKALAAIARAKHQRQTQARDL